MNDTVCMDLDSVRKLALNALTAQGFSADQAAAIADTVTAAERDECLSHGLFRIPFYIKACSNPKTDAHAKPELVEKDSSVIRVDGKNGFCPLALNVGLPALISKAKNNGIAALAINNTYNIAALWPEVEHLAENNLVAFAFTASNAFVAPHGGNKPLFGTNPMAFSWPREGRPPLVFDQASSVSARGEIQLHAREGHALPDGWAIDKDGQPTNDPTAALAGAQLTYGGYKGSSIALMVELLAGALIGDFFSFESSAQDTHKVGAPVGGEFIIAISPEHCAKPTATVSATARAEQLFAKILEQDGTRLPSDRRFKARERTAVTGVNVNKALHDQLLEYAQV